MATKPVIFFSVAAITGLLGASARAEDLPAADWVPVMEVVLGVERVGFTPITKIEAKAGGWKVQAYRRSVLYDIDVDPHAATIRSVSAKRVDVCGATSAEPKAAAAFGEQDRSTTAAKEPGLNEALPSNPAAAGDGTSDDTKRDQAQTDREKTTQATVDSPETGKPVAVSPPRVPLPPSREGDDRTAPKPATSQRKSVAPGKSKTRKAVLHAITPRTSSTVIGPPRRPTAQTASPNPRRAAPSAGPKLRGTSRGHVVGPDGYHWYR